MDCNLGRLVAVVGSGLVGSLVIIVGVVFIFLSNTNKPSQRNDSKTKPMHREVLRLCHLLPFLGLWNVVGLLGLFLISFYFHQFYF